MKGERREVDTSAAVWEKVDRYNRVARVVAIERLTPTGTVKITFEVIDDRPFTFFPGCWVGIEEDVPGLGVHRSPYCILSQPTPDRRFDALLRVFTEGPLVNHLASLRPGHRVRFRGPAGRSMVPKRSDTDLVLAATGVGVSPLYALCLHLLAEGDQRRIRLYWGLRLAEDICLVDELNALVARHPDFSYRITLSRPPPGWSGLRGRLTESLPPLLESLGGHSFYLSGNGAMVEEMEVALSSLGVDRAYIHQERFFNIRHRPDRATTAAILGRFVAHDLTTGATGLGDLDQLFPLSRDVHGRIVGPP